MRKGLVIVILCCLFSLCLTGCEKDKEETDIKEDEKINLNDNIYYTIGMQLTNKDCGGFGFPINAEDILDERWFSSYENLKYVDKIELLSHNDIIYDKEKEKISKEKWDNLKVPERGIAELSLGYSEHELYLGYWYINLLKDEEGSEFIQGDNYYELAKTIEQEVNNLKDSAYSIIKENEGYRFQGTCGGPAYEILLLDEAACNKYNLECARW